MRRRPQILDDKDFIKNLTNDSESGVPAASSTSKLWKVMRFLIISIYKW